MNPSSLLLLLLMGVVTMTTAADTDHLGPMAKQVDEWKKCNKKFLGFSKNLEEAATRCQKKGIKEHLCFVTCVLIETKMVAKGTDGALHWDEKTSEDIMAMDLWAPGYGKSGSEWWWEINECVKEAVKKGLKWKEDYQGSCADIEPIAKCGMKGFHCREWPSK